MIKLIGIMLNCLICGFRKNYPLCEICIKNAYNIEVCRQILAENKDLVTLRTLYDVSLPGIKDLNSSFFWNNKLDKIIHFNDQDGMTKDRVYTAISYIKKDTKRVLDVGAGYGFFEEALLKKGLEYELYGFDISQRAITNLKKRFIGTFSIQSFYNFSYPNVKFDTVIALEVLEHIPPSKTFNVISKFKEVLSSNGQLIISIPLNEGLRNKKDNPSGHVREYTYPLIKFELISSGFDVTNYKELYAFKNLYGLKKIISNWRLSSRWEPNDCIINAVKK